MEDFDMIKHLLEVESEASVMVTEAQKISDEKIAAAKAEAETIFKNRYSGSVKVIETKESSELNSITESHNKQFDDYKQNLLKSELDKKSFNSLLDKLLYA